MDQFDVAEICQNIAAQYPGWHYHAQKFKYKKLSHSEIWIDPSWVLHLSAEPSVMVYNKSVNKARTESFKGFKPAKWTCRMLILAPNAHNNVMIYRKLVHTLPDAEAYIADFFARGVDLVQRHFSSPDEKIFLSSYPIVGEFPDHGTSSGYEGLGNCIARAVLLDFDYVERFIRDDFPTDRPIYEPYRERVKEWLPIWRERAERNGSILKP